MPAAKHPPGPVPAQARMTLGNMREQGVQHLVAHCHNDACRNQAPIDRSKCPDDVEVPWFQSKVKCGKCGRKGR